MTVQARPSPSILRGMFTEGGEMGEALKGLLRTTYATTPQAVERRKMEQNKGIAKDMFGKARTSLKSLEPPSADPPARSKVHGQFRDRSDATIENQLRHFGITDRYDGAQAIKHWQAHELAEIDRGARQAVDKLREDRDKEIE
ncbi:hypothetical protein [Lichenifustis flavocetrariae]|uniref:Uncharacterized protein n=1 Tax=Lichenifustis flavocetrariae TaxID=2949735 RepID=A0AA42CMT2_9HYPH|nr:hypothetical protein [Lichenifustis flavocetrariae]MCW6513024.1 hypothetical protein [Lichenifustis flavocetrariae]